jgi:hypothetical protein
MYNNFMLNWFKKHFIPHEGNDHRPHFLHKESIRNILILVVFVEVIVFLGPTICEINKSGGMASVLPALLGDLTNEERQSQNLLALNTNPILNKAAEMKANDMATKGYFAHTSPEGKTPWYWLEQVGYKYQYAGENLAINFTDSKDVTVAWMNSPTHKANIVKDKYTEVGTGVATGMYEGQETIFVAQVYANPLVKEVEKSKTVKQENTEKEIVAEIKNVNDANILGAETETELKEQVKKEDAVSVVEIENKVVNTPEIKNTQNETPTFIEKAIASPRNSTNIIFYIIFGVVLLSLLLNIFIKIKHHHPDLITNGLVTLAIIGAIFVANYYMTHKNMTVLQSIEYSSEMK